MIKKASVLWKMNVLGSRSKGHMCNWSRMRNKNEARKWEGEGGGRTERGKTRGGFSNTERGE